MTVLIKIIDGVITELGSFNNGDDAFSLMMKDFLKEAGAENIPEYINEDFVGCNLENLEELIENYELYTEYGYDDGDGNSLFLSKGCSNYYWKLGFKE